MKEKNEQIQYFCVFGLSPSSLVEPSVPCTPWDACPIQTQTLVCQRPVLKFMENILGETITCQNINVICTTDVMRRVMFQFVLNGSPCPISLVPEVQMSKMLTLISKPSLSGAPCVLLLPHIETDP